MTPQVSASAPSRLFVAGEWVLVLGLAATQAWTTLSLGGYLAQTMITTSWAVFALAALGGLLWLGEGRSAGWKLNLAVLWPLPFLLYALASVGWLAPAKWLAWREWLLWFQMWLVFALLLHFGRGRWHTAVFAGMFAVLGLAGMGMAVYQRFFDHSWMMLGRTQAEQFIGRSSGMFGIPNSLAALLELMIPVCLALLFSRAVGITAKVFCGVLASLFVLALVLTGSRGGWIGLGLALMVWSLLGSGNWVRRITGVALILAFSTAGLALLYRFSAYAQERIQPFLEGKFESSRPLIWKAGWRMWQESPWFGRGAASYNVLFEQYRPARFLNEPDWTHNDYLNTLSDYGLVGFVLWVGAGAALWWLGWRAVRRAFRQATPATPLFGRPKWLLGLLIGLTAFGVHLAVDFHTKIPALAFALAIIVALVVRTEAARTYVLPPVLGRLIGLVAVIAPLLLGWKMAGPLYRSEAFRYESRRNIDRYAKNGRGDYGQIVAASKASFVRAVRTYPENGQAWSDLSYATMQGWHVGAGDLGALGRYAELAADEALKRCPLIAEFWVRRGVALDAQKKRDEADICFRRAVELAPASPIIWYYNAFHLSMYPNRKAEALAAVTTSLSLDPALSVAVSLHEKLRTTR